MATAGYFDPALQAPLKPIFDNGVDSAINTRSGFWKDVERDAEKINFSGQKYNFTVKIGMSDAFGGRPEMGDMPDGSSPEYIPTSIDVRHFYGTMKQSTISVLRGRGKGSVIKLTEQLIDDMSTAIGLRMNRMLMAAGIQDNPTVAHPNLNGVACLCNGGQIGAGTVGAPLLVHGYLGWTKGGGATYVDRGNDALVRRANIVIGTAAQIIAGTAQKRRVVSRSQDGLSVVLDAPITVNANDLVVRGDSGQLSGCEYNANPSGLGFLQFQDETAVTGDKFQGQFLQSDGDQLLYKPMRASMNAGAPGVLAAFSWDRVTGLIKYHRHDVGAVAENEKQVIVSRWNVHQEYQDTLADRVRFSGTGEHGEPEAETSVIVEGRRIKWVFDRMCPLDKMFVLAPKTFVVAEMEKGSFHTWDSGGMWRDLTNQHVKVARWFGSWNLACRTLGANMVIDDILVHT